MKLSSECFSFLGEVRIESLGNVKLGKDIDLKIKEVYNIYL